MNYQEYANKNKEIQNKLLLYLDKEDEIEENYQNLHELITSYKIMDNQHELRSLLYLISNISNNHYQTPSFGSKIERLLESLIESIKSNFTNLKIFEIFKKSKSILLFLIEREIMTFDQSILNLISSTKYFKRSYHQFFFPEIQPLIEKRMIKVLNDETNSFEKNYENGSIIDDDDDDDDTSKNFPFGMMMMPQVKNIDSDLYQNRNFINFYQKFTKKLPDNFFKQRKNGQNENHICKLIREDLIDEFITYVNLQNFSIKSNIKRSIYETNSFLIKNKITLIEYASFYGSTQIFKYLYKNGVELTSKLWIYAIHSDNPEIIQLLEENKVEPPNESYEECIKESIKCHHNDITNYILSNLIKEDIENVNNINFQRKYNENIYSYSFHYYNFSYFPKEIEHQILFYYACEYDYFEIVEYFLKTKKIDINAKIIITNKFNDILNQIFL